MKAAFASSRDLIVSAVVFGAAVNLLYLAPSLFMLQVYDRVLQTGGLTTLLFISLALLFALATLAFLDGTRSRLLSRLSLRLDKLIAPTLLAVALRRGQRVEEPERLQLMREFDLVRQAITGPAASAVMDAPWAPIYVIVCALIHPLLGVAVAIGGAALVGVAIITERSQRAALAETSAISSRIYASQEADSSSAATVRALGMRRALIERQMDGRTALNEVQTKSLFGSIRYSSATKFLRLALQSGVLGLGAWLAINQQVTPGAMIAASILSSRALAPLEQIVGAWRQIGQARNAFKTIDDALQAAPDQAARTNLPSPRGLLRFERVSTRFPNVEKLALADVSFEMEPGEILGVIGPSGAGKSTLARIAAGAVAPLAGVVRLDGANYVDWEPDTLGRHIGYLPQDIHLLFGTIADNIRRFAARTPENADEIDAQVIAASKEAGAHDMILRLPHGYDTVLGLGGSGLSLGQAQRVALARALFRSPPLLVLDEPNAHLDQEGEAALAEAITNAKKRGASVLLVAHRAGILAHADRLMVLVDSRMQMIGPREEVIRRQAAGATPIRSVQT